MIVVDHFEVKTSMRKL